MRIFGYARASTREQVSSIDIQSKRLIEAGVTPPRLHIEQVSGKNLDREQLKLLMIKVESGDKLLVTKIDRLARNTLDLLQIVKELKEKGVFLEFLDEKINTSTPTGELLLTLLGSIAQLERSTILERTQRGREEAKEKGVKFGRKISVDYDKVILLYKEGKKIREIERECQVSKSGIFKILKKESILMDRKFFLNN